MHEKDWRLNVVWMVPQANWLPAVHRHSRIVIYINEFRTKKESCGKISARSLSTSKTDCRCPGGSLICANSFPPNHIDAHAANTKDLKCLCMIFPIFRFACFGHSFFSTLFRTLWSAHANIHRICSFNSVRKNEIKSTWLLNAHMNVEVDLKLNERWDDDRNRNFFPNIKGFSWWFYFPIACILIK